MWRFPFFSEMTHNHLYLVEKNYEQHIFKNNTLLKILELKYKSIAKVRKLLMTAKQNKYKPDIGQDRWQKLFNI